MLRNYGRVKFYTNYKLSNGIIRGNHRLMEFSDRDIIRFEAPFGIRSLGKQITNRKLIETCDNFRPDLIIIGHCDIITENTLYDIQNLLPHTKIAHWFLDCLWTPRNIRRLQTRMHSTDAIFITTGGAPLKQFCTGKNRVAFIPNPIDPSWESHNNAIKTEFERDLVFCGNHSKLDFRYKLLLNLKHDLQDALHFDIFGASEGNPVWGDAYDAVLAGSKMGLNLNKEEGWPLYSSDRIAQLMGNGLLTCIWDKGEMRRLFTDEQVLFFKDATEFSRKIRKFHENDTMRQTIALNGYKYYHEHFSAERVVQFMIDTTFDLPHSHNYIWADVV